MGDLIKTKCGNLQEKDGTFKYLQLLFIPVPWTPTTEFSVRESKWLMNGTYSPEQLPILCWKAKAG